MKTYKVAVLPGDGIGPEVMEQAQLVLDKVASVHNLNFKFTEAEVGGIAIDNQGAALPNPTLEVCRQADAILFGSVGGPKWENLPPKEQPERAALLPLRKHFRLFANLRPGLLYPSLLEASPLKNNIIPHGIDILCVRELTGGIYFGEPRATKELVDGDVEAIDTMVYRKSEIERIIRIAVSAAQNRKKRICLVDKANVLETSVLWRRTVQDYIQDYAPDMELHCMYVDNAAMQLVRDPNQFDVIVTENLFGDILSDEMGVVCGSLGMLASASLGLIENSHDHPFGLFEPAGGTAPDIAGKNLANPCAQILSAALMLRYSLGLENVASSIENAVRVVVDQGVRTGDIAFGKTSVSTTEMGEAIRQAL